MFVRLSHYSISISSGAHYDLWVIYSQCAIFTATNQSPSSTICSHSKIHPYDTVQPTEEEKYRELLNVLSVVVTPNRNRDEELTLITTRILEVSHDYRPHFCGI